MKEEGKRDDEEGTRREKKEKGRDRFCNLTLEFGKISDHGINEIREREEDRERKREENRF